MADEHINCIGQGCAAASLTAQRDDLAARLAEKDDALTQCRRLLKQNTDAVGELRARLADAENMNAKAEKIALRLAEALDKIRVQGEQYMEMYQLNSDARTRLAEAEAQVKQWKLVAEQKDDARVEMVKLWQVQIDRANIAEARLAKTETALKDLRNILEQRVDEDHMLDIIDKALRPDDSAPAVEPCKWCGRPVTEQTERPADYCVHDGLTFNEKDKP